MNRISQNSDFEMVYSAQLLNRFVFLVSEYYKNEDGLRHCFDF